MIRDPAYPPHVPARAIAGGFVPIPARLLLHAWRICRARPHGMPDFRAYLACREVAARRHLAGEGRMPSFTSAELARLLGVAERRARASVARLVADGLLQWSPSAIAFPGPPGLTDDGLLADSIGRGRGDLAVPRRLLRFLARGARPALVAAALGLLLRCLSRRRAGFDGRGRAKATWIARAFGLDIRSIKAARRELVALGWVAPEPSSQAAENRWGRAYRIDLGWAGPHAPAGDAVAPGCRESTPPRAPACRESTPPLSNQDPLREGIRNQDPAPGGPAGVDVSGAGGAREATPAASMAPAIPAAPARAGLPAPRLADVRTEDLRDPARVLELHRQAVAKGLVGDSEADRLKFAAAAEHARAAGTINPGGLFATLVRRGWWHFATQADEDAAAARLKRHLFGKAGGVVVRPGVGPRAASSSADALLVREVRAAVARAGGRMDPFPLVRSKDPSWTRERWDRASAELEEAAPAAIGCPGRGPSAVAPGPIRTRLGIPSVECRRSMSGLGARLRGHLPDPARASERGPSGSGMVLGSSPFRRRADVWTAPL